MTVFLSVFFPSQCRWVKESGNPNLPRSPCISPDGKLAPWFSKTFPGKTGKSELG